MPLFALLIILLLVLTVLYACCLVFWETLDNVGTQENNRTDPPVTELEVSIEK